MIEELAKEIRIEALSRAERKLEYLIKNKSFTPKSEKDKRYYLSQLQREAVRDIILEKATQERCFQ